MPSVHCHCCSCTRPNCYKVVCFGTKTPAMPTDTTDKTLADGLSTIQHELRLRLNDDSINICLIQDTKLVPKDITAASSGFCAIRADRPTNQRGGGLLTLIGDDLVLQEDWGRIQSRLNASLSRSSSPVRNGPQYNISKQSFKQGVFTSGHRLHDPGLRLNPGGRRV